MSGHSQAYTGKRIFWVVLLNAFITVAEVVGGILSGSLALLSDAVHNLSDTAAVVLAYIANKIAGKAKDAKRTYGYKRAEILAAFINSAVLLAISLVLLFEAYKRLRAPEVIDGTLMIAVALIGLLADLLSVFLLQKDAHKSLNIKASYLHLISDTISSVGVLAGGIAIKLWEIVWVDPLVTILIALYVAKETIEVIKKTINILMQSAPPLDFAAIQAELMKVEKVKNIHHVHSWMVDEKTIHFEAHIDLDDMLLSEVEKVYDRIEAILKGRYGISHVTLQAEVDRCCDKYIFEVKEE
ncbi:MAG TPA: cation transporter [Firmicutes bacterium]|jgi:cobalt-zinc-cadmium efflux system protein|nr:cation transporter [Bacillota bacterium]